PGACPAARAPRLRRLLCGAWAGEGSRVRRAGAARRPAPRQDCRAPLGGPVSPSHGAEPRRQRGRRRSRRPRARLAPEGARLARPAPRGGDGPGAGAHAGSCPLSKFHLTPSCAPFSLVACLLSFILSTARGLAQTINAAPVESVLDGTQECPWSSFPGSRARRPFVIPHFFL